MTATIYYFTGENGVDMSAETKRWTGAFIKKHSALSMAAVDALHDEESNIKKALAASKAGSLFGDTNLVILKNILSSKKYNKEVKEIINKPSPNNFFLFIQDEIIEDTENEKHLKKLEKEKQAVIKKFPIPATTDLIHWTVQYAKKKGIIVSVPNARKVIDAFPSLTETKNPKKESIWFLAKEIDKLASYCYPKKEITEKAITEIVTNEDSFIIWNLMNAIVAGKKVESVTLLEKRLRALPHTKHDGELRMIFAMLQTQIRKLLLMKKVTTPDEKSDLANRMKWSPQHLTMLGRQAGNLSEEHLIDLQKKLIDLYQTAIDEPKNLEVKTVVNLLF